MALHGQTYEAVEPIFKAWLMIGWRGGLGYGMAWLGYTCTCISGRRSRTEIASFTLYMRDDFAWP